MFFEVVGLPLVVHGDCQFVLDLCGLVCSIGFRSYFVCCFCVSFVVCVCGLLMFLACRKSFVQGFSLYLMAIQFL
jgi:hypothetical protein